MSEEESKRLRDALFSGWTHAQSRLAKGHMGLRLQALAIFLKLVVVSTTVKKRSKNMFFVFVYIHIQQGQGLAGRCGTHPGHALSRYSI